eukprot:354499-Chlamydomonas_euryale.AAC.4
MAVRALACMGMAWASHGRRMGAHGRAWAWHGRRMGVAWASHGRRMGVAWACAHGLVWACLSVHGWRMGIAWACMEVHGRAWLCTHRRAWACMGVTWACTAVRARPRQPRGTSRAVGTPPACIFPALAEPPPAP